MKPGRSFPYTPIKFRGHFSIGPSDVAAQLYCLTRPSISGAAADFFTSRALALMAAPNCLIFLVHQKLGSIATPTHRSNCRGHLGKENARRGEFLSDCRQGRNGGDG